MGSPVVTREHLESIVEKAMDLIEEELHPKDTVALMNSVIKLWDLERKPSDTGRSSKKATADVAEHSKKMSELVGTIDRKHLRIVG